MTFVNLRNNKPFKTEQAFYRKVRNMTPDQINATYGRKVDNIIVPAIDIGLTQLTPFISTTQDIIRTTKEQQLAMSQHRKEEKAKAMELQRLRDEADKKRTATVRIQFYTTEPIIGTNQLTTRLYNTVSFNTSVYAVRKYFKKYQNIRMEKDGDLWNKTQMDFIVNDFNRERVEIPNPPFPITDGTVMNDKLIYLSPISEAEIGFISDALPIPKKYKVIDTPLRETYTEEKINSKYIEYIFNEDATDLKTLFSRKYSVSEMVSSQLKDGACLYNAFMTKYAKKILDTKDRYKKFKQNPTIDYLLSLTNKQIYECSIIDFIPVLACFGIDCKIFSADDSLVYSLPNDEHHYTLSKRFETFNIMVSNNHAYLLDSQIKKTIAETTIQEPSTNFHILESKAEKKLHYIHSIDDIFTIIKQTIIDNQDKLTPQSLTMYYAGELEEVYGYLRDTCKYTPDVQTDGHVIKSLEIVLTDVTTWNIRIKNCNNTIQNESQLSEYSKANQQFYESFMNKTFLSSYNSETRDIWNQTPRTAIRRRFTEISAITEYYSVDISKSYPNNLMMMEKIPVFTFGDVFVPYTGEEIEPYNFYILYVPEKQATNPRDMLYINKTYERVTGFTLMQYTGSIKYEIKYVCKPSNLYDNPASLAVQKVMSNSNLSMEQKKLIMNTNIGLMGKKSNTSSNHHIFTNFDEAIDWANMLNSVGVKGQVKAIEINNVLYYHASRFKKVELTNGFIPIRDFIYDIQRIEMWKMYDSLAQWECVGCDTDAIFLNSKPNRLTFGNEKCYGIGKIRVEDKMKRCPQALLEYTKTEMNINTIQKIKRGLFNEINWKTDTTAYVNEFANIVEKHKRIFIRGASAGAGKSALAKQYIKMKGNGLIITPYNTLSVDNRSEGFKSITLYMLIGKVFTTNGDRSTKAYDVSNIDVIFFDEVFNYSVRDWERISNFIRSNPDKKYICSGCEYQNQPIEELNNVKNTREFYTRIRDSLFNVSVNLEINKRATPESAAIFANIKHDLFNTTKPICDIMKQYIKHPKNCVDMFNICYTNKWGCDEVNEKIHLIKQRNKDGILFSFEKNYGNNIVRRFEFVYYVGLDLICRTPFRTQDGKLYTNNKYTITEIDENNVVLFEELEGLQFILPIDTLKYFSLPYASTGHRTQGLTITGDICIHESSHYHASREWVYTAITRARDINNVYYL